MEHNDEIQFDDLICMDELMNININTNKFPHFCFSASEKMSLQEFFEDECMYLSFTDLKE